MTDPIFTRVSVREFRDLPVDDALITKLLKVAMQAPSAGDQRPWAFWVVTDPKTKEALSLASPYAGAAAKAPVVIVPASISQNSFTPKTARWICRPLRFQSFLKRSSLISAAPG